MRMVAVILLLLLTTTPSLSLPSQTMARPAGSSGATGRVSRPTWHLVPAQEALATTISALPWSAQHGTCRLAGRCGAVVDTSNRETINRRLAFWFLVIYLSVLDL